MARRQQKSQRFFWISLTLHAAVFLALIISLRWSAKTPVEENSDKNLNIVQAAMVMKPLPVPKKISVQPPTPKPQITQPPPLEKVATKKLPEPPVPKVKALETVHQKTLALLKEKKQQEQLRKQLLADMQKDVDQQQQKKKKQRSIEEALAKEQKALAENLLQQQLRQEEVQLSGAKKAEIQGVVDKYKARIIRAIGQQWLIPSGANKKLYCELMIRIAPGGAVLDVEIAKTSGDTSLDRSARAAVYKASPLPVPTEKDAFAPFKQFVLRVQPENVLGG